MLKILSQNFKMEHIIIFRFEKTLSLLCDRFSYCVIYSHMEKKNEEVLNPPFSPTFCSQNILLWNILKFAVFSSSWRNEGRVPWKPSTSQGAELPSPASLRWAPSPAAFHLAGPREMPHVSAGVALDDHLLLLFLAESVIFFWRVITFSRAGFLPELKTMTNRPFLTTCYDSSLD